MRAVPVLPAGTTPAVTAPRAEAQEAQSARPPEPSSASPATAAPSAASQAAKPAQDSTATQAAAPAPDTAAQAAAEPLRGACPVTPEGLEVEEEDATEDAGDGEESETASASAPTGPVYTADLSDEELKQRWKSDLASLGSIAVGFVHSGRMVNAVRFPKGAEWSVVSPELAWCTQETVDYLTRAIKEVKARNPGAPLIRVNQISAKDGGWLRPHKSHQNGRDVDLGFYYPGNGETVWARDREHYIDPKLNWELLRALVTLTDVQMILVDSRVQKVLYDYALSHGEDKAWLDSLFNPGEKGIIKHAKHHRDHFHVRFFNPRAQELGRRAAPLLAQQPGHNLAMHKVRSGDTLGGIAARYKASVKAIQQANRMRKTFLRIGQMLTVPLRGPCTQCPIPPPVVVPPRRLPPEVKVAAQASASKPEAHCATTAPAAAPAAATPTPAPAEGAAQLTN